MSAVIEFKSHSAAQIPNQESPFAGVLMAAPTLSASSSTTAEVTSSTSSSDAASSTFTKPASISDALWAHCEERRRQFIEHFTKHSVRVDKQNVRLVLLVGLVGIPIQEVFVCLPTTTFKDFLYFAREVVKRGDPKHWHDLEDVRLSLSRFANSPGYEVFPLKFVKICE